MRSRLNADYGFDPALALAPLSENIATEAEHDEAALLARQTPIAVGLGVVNLPDPLPTPQPTIIALLPTPTPIPTLTPTIPAPSPTLGPGDAKLWAAPSSANFGPTRTHLCAAHFPPATYLTFTDSAAHSATGNRSADCTADCAASHCATHHSTAHRISGNGHRHTHRYGYCHANSHPHADANSYADSDANKYPDSAIGAI